MQGATCWHTKFQFTPLREGRLFFSASTIRPFNFNSRPSARGDNTGLSKNRFSRISIHAPPRGATDARAILIEVNHISIHAPPRGATVRAAAVLPRGKRFQFTPLREGRHSVRISMRRIGKISIHAPPRGATAKDMQFLQIFCSTLTNQHGLTIVPRNLSRLFW